jgi:histidinol-phosphatase (PHP family)
MIDLHVHTSRCGHADGSLSSYAEAARDAGVSILGFSDHLPLPDGFPTGYAMSWRELPQYVDEVLKIARRCQRRGGPDVLLGIEADWLPGHDLLIAGALRAHPFDYAMGSVHFLDGWAFDDPDQQEEYARWTTDALWARYFEDLAAAAASGLFDVMAHPDLVKKFGRRPDTDVGPMYEEIAAVLAECGVAIEVNTAGLRKPCAEIYPAKGLLEACHRRGVRATIGSDAHRPADVGSQLEAARVALRDAGYLSVLIWRGRVAEEVSI